MLPGPLDAVAVSLNILLIEDNPPVAEVTRASLESLGHNVVEVLRRGAEAVAFLPANSNFDLIVCDYNLPDMTALDLLGRVGTLHVGVVVYSGGSALPTVTDAYGSWVVPLEKPFRTEELQNAIERAIRV